MLKSPLISEVPVTVVVVAPKAYSQPEVFPTVKSPATFTVPRAVFVPAFLIKRL